MFGWFKKKKNPSLESAQETIPTITFQQPTVKSIATIDQEKKDESERLHQERQAQQQGFDPFNLDLTDLGQSELNPAEAQFLKKIANQPVENPNVASYWLYEYGIKFSIVMTKLLENGYLEICSAADNLDYLTVSELKDILRKNSLPLSGKKSDLIKRINQNVPKEVLSSHIGNHSAHYILTEKGKSATFNAHDSITKDTELEDACLAAIHKMDLNEAYRLVCEFEVSKTFSRGIEIDWKKRLEDGLTQQEHDFYYRILDEANDTEETYRECVILSHMLGVANPVPLIRRVCGRVDEVLLDSAQFALKKSKALMDIESYMSTGAKSYEILGTKDDHTCAKCRKMNGKKFLIAEAQIGENFPPFCMKCRCTTAPSF